MCYLQHAVLGSRWRGGAPEGSARPLLRPYIINPESRPLSQPQNRAVVESAQQFELYTSQPPTTEDPLQQTSNPPEQQEKRESICFQRTRTLQTWFSTSWESLTSSSTLRRSTVLRCSAAGTWCPDGWCWTCLGRAEWTPWSSTLKDSLKCTGPSPGPPAPAPHTPRTTATRWSTWTGERCCCRQVSPLCRARWWGTQQRVQPVCKGDQNSKTSVKLLSECQATETIVRVVHVSGDSELVVCMQTGNSVFYMTW